MGLLKEQYAEWKKVHLQCCCNQVWMKNGLADSIIMLYLSAKNHRSLIWWEDFIRETFLGKPRGRVTLSLCERPVKNPSIWKQRLTWIVPRIRMVRGVNLEGWRTGCRSWGVGDDGRIGNLLKKTRCEGSSFSKENGKFIFQSQMDEYKIAGGDQELRTSTVIREHPIRGEGHVVFLGESEGSLSPLHDSFPDAGEAMNDSWSMSGNFKHRHHVERRVNLLLFEKNHQEICLILGQVSLRLQY